MKTILSVIGLAVGLTCLAPRLRAEDEAQIEAWKKLYRRPDGIPYLPENAYSKAREELGKKLFFDPRLSGSGVMSCATCHNPAFAWSDGLPKGVGHAHRVLERRTPSVQNLAWTEKMMWDGRFSKLENQAIGPIVSELEMNLDPAQLVERIKSIPGYVELFAEAYPDDSIDRKLVGKALAVFERSLVSAEAPFDRWIQGEDKAISTAAVKGFALFNGKAQCASCHSGWRFTDDSFHDIGLRSEDIGRGRYLKLASQQHAFKVPGLRSIVERAPYMHDGSESSLATVIDFYDRGGDVRRESLSPLIKPLSLTAEEKKQLVEFLKTLSGREKAVELPALPR